MRTIRDFAAETDGIRRIQELAETTCFRAVTRIWHYPPGTVLLERDQRRDCLLPGVDRVHVPASDCHRVGDAVVLDADTTVEVTEQEGSQILTEVDIQMSIG
jgi:hypothetical protein